jgi:hypothetical protein
MTVSTDYLIPRPILQGLRKQSPHHKSKREQVAVFSRRIEEKERSSDRHRAFGWSRKQGFTYMTDPRKRTKANIQQKVRTRKQKSLDENSVGISHVRIFNTCKFVLTVVPILVYFHCVRTCSSLFFRCFWPTHFKSTPLWFVETKGKSLQFSWVCIWRTHPDPDSREASDNKNFVDYEIHNASSTIGSYYGEEHGNTTSALHPFFFSSNFLRT